MAGFVKEVTPRREAVEHVASSLAFPWNPAAELTPLAEARGRRLAKELVCTMAYPPYTRSLRDGYAVCSSDVSAATTGTPAFLQKTGSVLMGAAPKFSISNGEAASIPTGGVLPKGADAVVMLEDTSLTGGYVEVRRGVQSGENVICKGEELKKGQKVLGRGEQIDFRTASLLATIGVDQVETARLRISILSTGDEVVPVAKHPLPPGCIRDVNGATLKFLLARCGFESEYRGIVSDDGAEFEKRFKGELSHCDVLILSGGSSVGVRDHCSQMLEKLAEPGLLVRGINIAPGKPTLAAGCIKEKKLVVSLPGHPLSCLVAAYALLIPLLLRLIGAENEKYGHRLTLELASDVTAKTGPEEFMPCRLEEDGRVRPVLAKSGYVSPLSQSDGLLRVPENRETLRAGETVEVWLW
jgi:molybdopterin molybdotransferase